MEEKFKKNPFWKYLKKKNQGWIEHYRAQIDSFGRSGIFQSGVVWNILHSQAPSLAQSWQPASVCSSRLKHVHVCIWAALLVHPKEYLRVFHFWFLQGFLSGSPGLLGGNWTLKASQVSGNSEGMSSCLLQNLLQNLEQPCKMWPGRAASAAGLVWRGPLGGSSIPLPRSLSIQSKVLAPRCSELQALHPHYCF